MDTNIRTDRVSSEASGQDHLGHLAELSGAVLYSASFLFI